MEFCFLKASRSAVATGTFAVLLANSAGVSVAMAQDAQTPAGQQQAGQSGAAGGQAPAKQKNYKDRAEYDLYSKITQTKDPKQRLELLNTWQDKYPNSDFKDDRLLYFVRTLSQLAPNDATARQQLIDKCKELLKDNPNSFEAHYFITVWGPVVGGTSAQPDLLTTIQNSAQNIITNADTFFSSGKKPQNTSEADWQKQKNQVLGLAHKDLAYVAVQKKDLKTAENEYQESLKANPDQGSVSYDYAKTMQGDSSIPDDQKYPTVLFEYARAGEYDGPGALPANARPQVLSYFNKIYAQFHGSADGADQVLAQAKTSALPPSGFSIVSAADIAKNKAQQLQQRIDSDPAFKLWYGIEQSLIQQGDQFWNQMKGTEVPGTAVQGVQNFTGTVISVDPPDHPTKVVLGVTDPTKPDATLDFSAPIPADAVQVGSKIQFSGIAESYSTNPYMLTFKDPKIPGVKTPEPKSTPRRAAPRRHR